MKNSQNKQVLENFIIMLDKLDEIKSKKITEKYKTKRKRKMSKKYSSKRTVVTTKGSPPKSTIRVKDLDVGTIFRDNGYNYMLIKLEYPNEAEDGQCWLLDLGNFSITCQPLDLSVDEVYDYQINLQAQGIY